MTDLTNKNTAYVNSLVNFTLDTKPYHSKLTDVIVEYRFDESMNVRMVDLPVTRSTMKAAWLYDFFSSGNPVIRTLPVQRPVIPEFLHHALAGDALNVGAFRVGRDEVTDITNAPLVFDRSGYDGPGIADVRLAKSSGTTYRLVEGHDWHEGKGAFELTTARKNTQVTGYFEADYDANLSYPFNVTISVGASSGLLIYGPATQVSLTEIQVSSNGRVQVWGLAGTNEPVWSDTRIENAVATARQVVIDAALDTGNSNSSVNQLTALVTSLRTHLNSLALSVNTEPYRLQAVAEADALLTILAQPNLPASFDVFLQKAGIRVDPSTLTPPYPDPLPPLLTPPPGFTDWIGEDGTPPGSTYVDEALFALVPPLFFARTDGDLSLRESGELVYDDVEGEQLKLLDITVPSQPLYDEWTIECIATSPTELWTVTGAKYGYAGVFVAGGSFIRPYLSFTTTLGTLPSSVGDRLFITPSRKVVIEPSSPLETWNIIKTNPRAYSRPVFASTTYGHIEDALNQVGYVTILDTTLPSGSIVLTATSATTFTLTNTGDAGHVGSVAVGMPYSDGRVAFTIISGALPFSIGDQFIIGIVNSPAVALNLDLLYGYDVDPYDNPDLVYNNDAPLNPLYGTKLDFAFDSRFTDYDPNLINLTLTQAAVDGREWRLRAKPTGAPIATLKQDGSITSHAVDLVAGDSEYEYTQGNVLFPTGTQPIFTSTGGTDPNDADIYLHVSNEFEVEYLDSGVWVSVGTAVVGSPFVSAPDGLAFTIVPGSKPFIGALARDGVGYLEGGDLFYFTVSNPPPYQDPAPTSLVSPNVPWLELHGSGFWRAPAADWTLSFTSPTEYVLSGVYTEGPNTGNAVSGYPQTVSLATTGVMVNEGASVKTREVHYTVVNGALPFTSGDAFTFSTHSHKPSLLVHGAISGWQPDATIGEWYFNGKIGFKIEAPVARTWTPGTSTKEPTTAWGVVSWIRPDIEPTIYKLTYSTSTSQWIITNGERTASFVSVYSDDFIELTVDALWTADLEIEIVTDAFAFWNSPNVVISRSNLDPLVPAVGDYVLPRKADHASVGISLDFAQVELSEVPDITDLAPASINQTVIDLDTGPGGLPLSNTSPEVSLLSGWIPLMIEPADSVTSNAVFSDASTRINLRSRATGISVGTMYSATDNNEGWRLEWDSTFFNSYLPLNAKASVVIYGNGLDDHMSVRMTDRLIALPSLGTLAEDALFTDALTVATVEQHDWLMEHSHEIAANVAVSDEFDGFLPGYDNLPYDAEGALGLDIPALTAAQGQYDTGQALLDGYLRAVYLSLLGAPTPAESAELTGLLGLIGSYLQPGGLGATSFTQFVAAWQADVGAEVPPVLAVTLGLPKQGMAIDARKNDEGSTSASVIEHSAFTIVLGDGSTDNGGLDEQPLDVLGDSITSYVVRVPAGPVAIPNPSVTFPINYHQIASPLENRQLVAYTPTPETFTYSERATRVFEIQFISETSGLPIQVGSWVGPLPTFRFSPRPAGATEASSAPVDGEIVFPTYLGDSKFVFSLPVDQVGKITVT